MQNLWVFCGNLLCIDVFSHYLITTVMEFIPSIKEEPFGKLCAAHVASKSDFLFQREKPCYFPTALFQTHKYTDSFMKIIVKVVRMSVSGIFFSFYLFILHSLFRLHCRNFFKR